MRGITDKEVQKEIILLPLVFILLFFSGTVISLHMVFPVLRSLHPQIIFVCMAILFSVIHLFCGNISLRFEWGEKIYFAYCVVATMGLYHAAGVGWLLRGEEVVSIIWKHFAFLMVLIALLRTLTAISFAHTWILVTVALFVLHSMKAIATGYSGLAGRFDNYVGLISNADYIGNYTAVFVVVFLHVAFKKKKMLDRLSWFVLSVFSLIIMIKTQTRAAILILGVLAPYWILITSFSIAEVFRKGIAILLVVGALLLIGSSIKSDHGSYFDRILSIFRYSSGEADFNIKSRIFMWKQGITIGLANPVLGVGSGATTPYLDLRFEGVELKDKASKVEGFSMHNTFIQIFAERGSIGLILFCLMLLIAYRNLNVVARYAKEQPERQQLALLADVGRLYFVGYTVGAMFNTIDTDWTLFAFVALAVSSSRYIRENEPATNSA